MGNQEQREMTFARDNEREHSISFQKRDNNLFETVEVGEGM